MNTTTTTTIRLIGGQHLELAVRRAVWQWLLERATGFIAAVRAELAARRAIRELEMMGDRELADIGLTRAEVQRIAGSRAADGALRRHEIGC